MSYNVLSTIRTLYPALTPSGKNVADYVLTHGDEVIFMPITELAYRCSVSETSIMRFCRHAGMSGYQDFRLRLSSALAEEKDNEPQEGGDITSRIIKNLYNIYHTIIQGTCNLLHPEKLLTLSRMLRDAKQVYFFGSRDAMTITSAMGQTFMRTFRKGRYVGDGYSQELLLLNITRGDVAFFLSLTPEDRETYRLAERARHTGAKLASISCCGPTALDGLCSVNLYCGRTNPNSANGNPPHESNRCLASVSFLMELLCNLCSEMEETSPKMSSEPIAASPLPQTYYPDH